MKRKLLLSLLIIFTYSLYGQETVRIASYNVKQFPAYNNSSANLKVVLNQIKPTILLVTELDGSNGDNAVTKFLDNVLTPKYKASGEVNIAWGNGNECAVFYLDSLITYLGSNMISTPRRPIAEFKFIHKDHPTDTLIVFGVHLKANTPTGDNSPNIIKRAEEIDSLRKRTAQLKTKTNYVVVGDFNILTSPEPAFQKLLDQSSQGYFYDPLNAVGNWTDNSLFSYAHTYSPSYLKSRLDMILISQALKDKGGVDYIEDSYKIFGNDGKHFAKSITNGYNSWFTDISIGNALIAASDHLPVYADFSFGVPTSVSTTENIPTTFELKQNYPNPFNPTTVINYQLSVNSYVTLKIYDLLGREVAILVNEFQNAGIYHSTFSTLHSSLVSGLYFYQLRAGAHVQTKKMVLLR